MEKVVVRDIFDRTKIYQEITDFKEPFSEMIEPITNVKFVNGGACVEITYLTGNNYREVIEAFELDKA